MLHLALCKLRLPLAPRPCEESRAGCPLHSAPQIAALPAPQADRCLCGCSMRRLILSWSARRIWGCMLRNPRYLRRTVPTPCLCVQQRQSRHKTGMASKAYAACSCHKPHHCRADKGDGKKQDGCDVTGRVHCSPFPILMPRLRAARGT